MQYTAILMEGGEERGRRRGKGTPTKEELLSLGDRLYFEWIEGPKGPSYYPAAELLVRSGKSGGGPVIARLIRRADSNAAGMPDLWTEAE